MLTYVAEGTRRYGVTPFEANRRGCWEFQAVVAGAIGMTMPGRETRLRRRTLWLSPPDHTHGWTGDGRRPASVAVFHFPSVPEPLGRLARAGEAIEIALTRADCRRLAWLARRAGAYWRHPSPGMVMCCEHTLLELSLLVYEARKTADGAAEADDERRVRDALQWYAARLEANPGQEEVARAVNMSASHLRRLFHEVLETAPKQAFDQLRFQRATQLMADPGMKLATVGEACGFGSQSAFSRAFKAKFGCAPEAWRG